LDRINTPTKAVDLFGAGKHGFKNGDLALGIIPTDCNAEFFNAIQEELLAVIEGNSIVPDAGSRTQLYQALQAMSGIRKYSTGQALPGANIGPIWHDDYNSIMTWQAFTANGAAYTGYASLLVGGLLIDTQPTARQGYVKSGVSNLSRTTYAALRNWGLHHGVLVASGVWAAGAFAFKDNGDGTTFTVADVRGEFPRFWDDGRGVDSGRSFGSSQAQDTQPHTHPNPHGATTFYVSTISGGGGGSLNGAGSDILSYLTTGSFGGTETRPRNTALLASIKF
jgi:hypothetical protein